MLCGCRLANDMHQLHIEDRHSDLWMQEVGDRLPNPSTPPSSLYAYVHICTYTFMRRICVLSVYTHVHAPPHPQKKAEIN